MMTEVGTASTNAAVARPSLARGKDRGRKRCADKDIGNQYHHDTSEIGRACVFRGGLAAPGNLSVRYNMSGDNGPSGPVEIRIASGRR